MHSVNSFPNKKLNLEAWQESPNHCYPIQFMSGGQAVWPSTADSGRVWMLALITQHIWIQSVCIHYTGVILIP